MSTETSSPAAEKIESGKSHAKQAADDIRAAAVDLGAAASAKADELKKAATAKAEELKKAATTKADEFCKVASEVASEYRVKAESAVTDARVRAKSFQDESEKYIRENPIRAVATAFAAGIVFGLLIRR